MTKHLIAAAFAGCIAWAGLGSPSVASAQFYVEVDSGPPNIDEYPSTYYEGRPVYYYDGHWYYRHGPRWAYYREEPRHLVTYRASPGWREHRHYYRDHDRDHDRRAAPAPRYHSEHHEHHHRP